MFLPSACTPKKNPMLSYDERGDHPSRAEVAASFIPDHVYVLDIGAVSMVLRNYLRPNCKYTSCDMFDRGHGCIVADLNKGENWGGAFFLFEKVRAPDARFQDYAVQVY
jgi:tRNA (cmo5U34)-methyltransferase